MTMRLAIVYDKVREDALGGYVERACRELGLAHDHFWVRDADRIPSGYDLYLRVDHGDYQQDLPERLRPRVFYVSDTHLPKSWRQIARLAPRYDVMCCVHRQGAERLSNAVWVPVACDPALHGMHPLPKRWDLAFIGTEGGVPRKFYLQALRERHPDSFIGHAPHTELGALYSQARIGFNYSIRDDLNMRMFEILASGTLLVTNRLSHDDLGRLGLRDREHLVLYRSPQELYALLDYYLHQDREREAIARQGMAAALGAHTYRHRLVQMLRDVEGRLGIRGLAPHQSTAEASLCASS
ncbi:MAG: glycosyltransferase family 1 protein [Candidatus Omnitrophica bacterium]|nr:glycosyltransferase family 1 protein [Candidatus Omnitrophota bacterium]